jgi:D-glycero-alpha-D-manno-heptose-7-phosphate kinase
MRQHYKRAPYNTRVRITASAPTRIDLAGGTFDIWPLYLFHDRAQTINAALSLRASCTLQSRDDGRVVLRSADTGDLVDVASVRDLDLDRLPLVATAAPTASTSPRHLTRLWAPALPAPPP